jgi:hypothetical protein
MSTTINLPILDDSYVDSFQATTNYGSLPVLVNSLFFKKA